MLLALGERVVRLRWWIVAGWIALATVLAVVTHPIDPTANELATFLPDDAPSYVAEQAVEKYFPGTSGLSQAVVVMERQSPAAASAPAGTAPADGTDPHRLTPKDLEALDGLARRLRRPLPEGLAHELGVSALSVRSPHDFSAILQPNPLVSPDGAAALATVPTLANFVTMRSFRTVEYVRQAVAETNWPPGVRVAVTGPAAFGHDYAAATNESHRRSLTVTVLAVLTILLVVYRAPLAAATVLGTISLAAVTAHLLLAATTCFGRHVGTAEMIFVMVLLYGAGVDYSLLYLSRFRELLGEKGDVRQAAARAWAATAPTIAASAGTVIAGLLMLSAADFRIFRTTGQAVGLALAVVLLAALTVVPALAAIAHGWLFWPRQAAGAIGSRRMWTAVAGAVTSRPRTVFLLTLGVLVIPATAGTRLHFVYDTLTGLGPTQEAVVGVSMAKRHWPVGHITPTTILLEARTDRARAVLPGLSARLTAALEALGGVSDVRSLSQPLGAGGKRPDTRLLIALAARKVRQEYLSPDGSAVRLYAVQDSPAFSTAAMDMEDRMARACRDVLPPDVALHVTGANAEMADVRQVTQRDFYRVGALTLAVVFLIVLALLRDGLLCAFMVASTVLSYLATLGGAWWFFTAVLGQPGLDWKVEVFLFVVMVAVGQDYNIFLAARLAEEARFGDVRAGARSAIIRTGGVISSAGLIMAATLGSLAASDLVLLRQLGFAFALGMLMDTFLVRPLLLPAFAVLTRRTGRPLSRQ